MPLSVFLLADVVSLTPEAIGRSVADALVLDLTSEVPDRPALRRRTHDLLLACRELPRRPLLLAKISAFASGWAEDDLKAVMAAHPDGVLLSFCQNGAEVQKLHVLMDVHEAELGRTVPPAIILAEFGATAASLLAGSSYAHRSARLRGLVWDETSLARNIGLLPGAEGTARDILNTGRGMTVLRASEAGIAAILSLRQSTETARRTFDDIKADGFSGIMTGNPALATRAKGMVET